MDYTAAIIISFILFADVDFPSPTPRITKTDIVNPLQSRTSWAKKTNSNTTNQKSCSVIHTDSSNSIRPTPSSRLFQTTGSCNRFQPLKLSFISLYSFQTTLMFHQIRQGNDRLGFSERTFSKRKGTREAVFIPVLVESHQL